MWPRGKKKWEKKKKKNPQSGIRRKIVTVTWMDAGHKKGFESLMMTNSGSSTLKGSAVSQSDMQYDKKLLREERNMWAYCFYYNWAISRIDTQTREKYPNVSEIRKVSPWVQYYSFASMNEMKVELWLSVVCHCTPKRGIICPCPPTQWYN